MKYKVRTIRGKHPAVEVQFEDAQYALAGEMLLAERAFLGEMLKTIDSVLEHETPGAESFSGNAFNMFVTAETTKITNEINGEETEAPTGDLKKLIKVYQKQYGKLQR